MTRLFKFLTFATMLTFILSACSGQSAPVQDTAATTGDEASSQQADAVAEDEAGTVSGSPYPQQFATIVAYTEATGNGIASFKEAPILAERVASGELPPVEERLPVEPAVVQPLESIGVYGGELVGPATSPTSGGWDASETTMQKSH